MRRALSHFEMNQMQVCVVYIGHAEICEQAVQWINRMANELLILGGSRPVSATHEISLGL